MNKKRILSIFIVFFIIFLISTNLNVVLAANYKGAEGESSWDAFLNYFVATIRENKSNVTDDEIWRFSKGPTKDEEQEGVNMYTGDSALSDVRETVDDLVDKRNIDIKSDVAPSKTKNSSTTSTNTKTENNASSQNSDGKYEYKGFKSDDSEWDAFYDYFMNTWSTDQTKLTTDELKRYSVGPTKDDEKNGQVVTKYIGTIGSQAVTKDDVLSLIDTRNASGNDSAALDNEKYDKVRKEAIELYNEYTGYSKKSQKNKRKKAAQKFLNKCYELKKLNNGRTMADSDITGKFNEVAAELSVSTDTFYGGQTGESESNTPIYVQPTVTTNKTSGSTLDDMMTDADNFVKSGDNDKIKSSDLQKLSGIIYNIALQIGIGVAVIAGLALGIQFMMSSVEGKADVKKGLKVYVIGCVVVFGSFGIWKLIVTLMQQI